MREMIVINNKRASTPDAKQREAKQSKAIKMWRHRQLAKGSTGRELR